MDWSTPASLYLTISWSLLKVTSFELVMPSNHLILCCPFLLLPSIFFSIRVFSSVLSLCIRWPSTGASASASTLSMNIQGRFPNLGLPELISLQSTGLSKSLLQHHSSKASILQHLTFFIVQLSHPNMTTGKNIALTRWTFVGKVISLLFNML